MKVPAIVACSLICLMLGAGAGAMGMTMFGYRWYPNTIELTPDEIEKMKANSPTPPAAPDGKGKGGMGGGKGGGMGKGPSAKGQLNSLVAKLDILTSRPLAISLDEDEKKQLAKQLSGLEGMDELPEVEAKQRLDALLATLTEHKDKLEDAGFRWPGSQAPGGFGGPKDVPNPFKEAPSAMHLQALQERVTK